MDAGARWWTTAEIDSYIEVAQDIIQTEVEMVYGTASATVTSSIINTTDIASDVLRLDAIYWNSQRLTVRSEFEMDQLGWDWRATTEHGPGVAVKIDEDTFRLWPPTNTSGLLYMEYPILTTFSTTTSTMQLPAWTKYVLPEYVCYRAYMRDGANNNLNRALRRKASFQRGLDSIKNTWKTYFPQKYTSLTPGTVYEADILMARRRSQEDGVAIINIPEIVVAQHAEEIPSGTVNGTNATFTIVNTPSPTTSLKLWVDGVLMTRTTHYTLSSTTITFVSSFKPITGQNIFTAYRYVG
jgi:hypothetical protein